MSLKLIPMPDLSFIPLDMITRVLEENSPFKDVNFKEENIKHFLNDVNGQLVERKNPDLEKNYVIAASVYIFVEPYVNMPETQGIEEKFLQIMQKKPYEESNPLTLYFGQFEQDFYQAADEAWIKEIDDKQHKKTLSITNSELEKSVENLDREYSEEEHLKFVSFYDVWRPMFGMKTKNYEMLHDYLDRTFGEFRIKIPDYFLA